MESKFNEIDEKLSELKLTKEVPDFSTLFVLLSGFSWTSEWFASIEDVLLAIAFRGESDKPILDFIRAKIVETDVITFNRTFLIKYGLPPVVNHYEIILSQSKDNGSCLIGNKNYAVINTLLDSDLDMNKMREGDLSISTNDRAIDFLIANPHKINWVCMAGNSNIKAAKFCIQNNKINTHNLSRLDNDEIVEYLIANPTKINYHEFSANPNQKAVDYLWDTAERSLDSISQNPNDRIVEYLLSDPENRINYGLFSMNRNDKAIDHLLANPRFIVCQDFYYSFSNKKIAKFMTTHLELFSESTTYLCENADDIAVDYLLANPECINWWWFANNSNDRALEYIIKSPRITDTDVMFRLCRNTCSYNMQKINAFNAAGLFPRLPHLKL